MKRVLLAWEAGAGRGHVVTLARVARALRGVAACDAALGWMDHAQEIAPYCDCVFPGVRLGINREARTARNAPPAATWAEYLLDCRFNETARIRTNVAWWIEVIRLRQIALVVADYAPNALMAARICGVPGVAVGTGYGIPPGELARFPVFLPEYATREADEAALVAAVNAAIVPLGGKPLASLPQVYARDGEMVRTLPLLDPYAAQRPADCYLPPVADYAGIADGRGNELFCYFSTREFENPALVEALATLGLPLACFLPNADAAVRERLRAAGAQISDHPLPVEEIAQRARLVFNSGQHGIACLALAAGLPQVCLPQHLEQLYHARRLEQAGAARVIWPRTAPADQIRQIVRDSWEDRAMANTAQHMARDLAAVFAEDDLALMRAQLSRWL
ncbi:MAG: glycosyltransferase [Erythrobacter sp.]